MEAKIKDIIDVLDYRYHGYYVGSLAMAGAAYRLGLRYPFGLTPENIKRVDASKIKTTWKYLRSYIIYMHQHPVSKCPTCGQTILKEKSWMIKKNY